MSGLVSCSRSRRKAHPYVRRCAQQRQQHPRHAGTGHLACPSDVRRGASGGAGRGRRTLCGRGWVQTRAPRPDRTRTPTASANARTESGTDTHAPLLRFQPPQPYLPVIHGGLVFAARRKRKRDMRQPGCSTVHVRVQAGCTEEREGKGTNLKARGLGTLGA